MSLPNLSLAGKVAIVTGARRGIGEAIALAFAEAGADVAICDIVVEDGLLQAVAESIKKLKRRSLAVQTDTTKKTEVDNFVQRVMDEFGAIDILVNNAGLEILAPLLDFREEDWDKIINVDLKGYFLCSQAVGRRMVERKKGIIINIASVAGLKPRETNCVYAIAKAGVLMLTRTMAKQVGRHNVRVNAIVPCTTRTKLSDPVLGNSEALKQRADEIPLGRIAETSDLAGTALFLASDASSFITGQTIAVDGGLLA